MMHIQPKQNTNTIENLSTRPGDDVCHSVGNCFIISYYLPEDSSKYGSNYILSTSCHVSVNSPSKSNLCPVDFNTADFEFSETDPSEILSSEAFSTHGVLPPVPFARASGSNAKHTGRK